MVYTGSILEKFNTVAYYEGQAFEHCHRSSAGSLGLSLHLMADFRFN